MNVVYGKGTIIEDNIKVGDNVIIGCNCIIEENVIIGNDVLIDNNVIIRSGVVIGDKCSIGANCILGEYQIGYDRKLNRGALIIGGNSIIRSGSILYADSNIGEYFQTGHNVIIREKTSIGNYVSVGTLSDIQGHCKLGNYVRLHSNVHVGQSTIIDDCCWIYPYVVFTNDPTPPSETELGVHVYPFAIIATNSVILPGIKIKSDTLVGAGTLVTKDIEQYQLVVGNPGKVKGDIRDIRDRKTGERHYPWRYYFDRAMPWAGFGYENWYNGLDEETKRNLIGKV